MNKQKLIITIVAAIGALSVFLPWATILGMFTITGTTEHVVVGWIGLILYLVPIVYCIFAGNREKGLQTAKDKMMVAIPAILVPIISLIRLVSALPSGSSGGGGRYGGEGMGNMDISGAFSLQIGVFLFLGAGVIVAILAFAMKAKDVSKT